MTRKLTERDVINLIREEYDRQLSDLLGELDTTGHTSKDDNDNIISVGLKVRHTDSNLLYTVSKVGLQDVELKTPEGQQFTVSREELEKKYSLD